MKELNKLLKNIEKDKVENFETELLNCVIVLNNRVLELEKEIKTKKTLRCHTRK